MDAGPRSGWERGQEEGLCLAFWWSLAGPGTGVKGTELGGWAWLQEGELGTRLGLCPHWKCHHLALVRSVQHRLCPAVPAGV